MPPEIDSSTGISDKRTSQTLLCDLGKKYGKIRVYNFTPQVGWLPSPVRLTRFSTISAETVFRSYAQPILEKKSMNAVLLSAIYSLALETQDGIGLQIGNVQLLALGDHLRVLTAQQPADVREEEATGCIVRIRVGLRVLVVHPVVASPVQSAVLERDRVEDGQDDAQGQLRLVRPMGPQAVSSGRDAQSGHDVQYKGYGIESETRKTVYTTPRAFMLLQLRRDSRRAAIPKGMDMRESAKMLSLTQQALCCS
uniref:Uncharacterized protein n=1 Tax=Anopheles atroparvus TaxID=41427 RepID=A0A182J8K7_ANOAO